MPGLAGQCRARLGQDEDRGRSGARGGDDRLCALHRVDRPDRVRREGRHGRGAERHPVDRARPRPTDLRTVQAAPHVAERGRGDLLFSRRARATARAPEHDLVWADEVGAWKDPMAWANMEFGLRRLRPDGKGGPRVLVTTTPRPTSIMRGLLAREGADVIVTRGRTMDNAANLSPAAVAADGVPVRRDAARTAGA